MSVELRAQVLGAEAVQLRMLSASDGAREKVRHRVQALGLELLVKVKEKLTGQSLHVRTGRLRRSTNERTTVDGDSATSSVGTNVVYARPWELGFAGVEQVRAHARRLGAKGKAVAQVRAHQRRVNMRARPFLRPSLDEMRERIREQLSGGVV